MEANTQVILSRRMMEGEKDALRGEDDSWVERSLLQDGKGTLTWPLHLNQEGRDEINVDGPIHPWHCP